MAQAAQEAAVRSKTVADLEFVWEGKDTLGAIKKGEIRAPSEAYARAMLRRQGILPIRVKKKQKPLLGDRSIKEKDLVVFTRQLATMLNAGLPIVQALELIGAGASNKGMQKLLKSIQTDVESGERLSSALAKFPTYFDKLYVALVSAGELGGILDTILLKLATYREKSYALKAKVKSALFYPTSIIVVAFIIIAILMIFVIPKFAEMFSGFGAELPALTSFVIKLSNGFVRYWYLVFGIPIAGIVALRLAYKRVPKVRATFDRMLLQMPMLGDILLKAAIARFTRTFSTMHAAGVPMTESLETIARTSGNTVIEDAIMKEREAVAGGQRLSQPLAEAGIFPPMVVQMINIGEESGALETMLAKVADFYESEVDEAVNRMTSLMEPMIMAFLGVVIGGLVIAMYLPIFKLASVVGG